MMKKANGSEIYVFRAVLFGLQQILQELYGKAGSLPGTSRV